jgi:hypothetical protein
MAQKHTPPGRPSAFIGSSREGIETARAIEYQLQDAVELDIVATQFGPLISPDFLKMIRQDLRDLEESTSVASRQ